jgi:hypothetical protein
MKLTIDTKLKQIMIEDSVSINELNSFIVKNGYNDYTIVSKEKIEADKLREWFNQPRDYITTNNLPTFNPTYYGGNDALDNSKSMIGKVTTNGSMSFGNFSKNAL